MSLTPPLVSVCFRTQSTFTARLRASGRWAVSVLAEDQDEVSRHFANPATASDLTAVPHVSGAHTSAALLTDSLASLECRTMTAQQAGDHVLFIGEVLRLHLHREAPPLVFCRGAYHSGPHTGFRY